VYSPSNNKIVPNALDAYSNGTETSRIVLPDAENYMIVSSFVWTQYRNVTDGQIDRQTDRQKWSSYHSSLHCEQCGRTLKTGTIIRHISETMQDRI